VPFCSCWSHLAPDLGPSVPTWLPRCRTGSHLDLDLGSPRKIRTTIKKFELLFPGNLGFRHLDWSHWIRLEILCRLVVFVSGTPIWTRIAQKSILEHIFPKKSILVPPGSRLRALSPDLAPDLAASVPTWIPSGRRTGFRHFFLNLMMFDTVDITRGFRLPTSHNCMV